MSPPKGARQQRLGRERTGGERAPRHGRLSSTTEQDQNPTNAAYAQLNSNAECRAKTCRTARMPCLTHLGLRDYDNVYEPSDDTYLLIDAIGLDIDEKMMLNKGENNHAVANNGNDTSGRMITLEIGCGTGVPTVYLALRLRGIHKDGDDNMSSSKEVERAETDFTTISVKQHITHYITDINPDAIRIAKSTAEVNGLPMSDIQAFNCDLASDIIHTLQNKVDILLLNPPYVPTPNEEVGSSGIEASWAGGTNGRVVLDRALPQIAQLLSFPNGVAYVVAVDDNYPEQIAQLMYDRYGIQVVPWLRRRARNEFLTILKMTTTRIFSVDDTT